MELTPVSPTAKAPARAFTGDVYVNPTKKAAEPSRLIASLVRFTPGARTNWHSHALGQTLHCTDGIGLVVTRDGTVTRMRPGDTVWTPPGEEHWHGSTTDNMMCHHAMLEGASDGDGTTWLEPVADDQYEAAATRDLRRELIRSTCHRTLSRSSVEFTARCADRRDAANIEHGRRDS